MKRLMSLVITIIFTLILSSSISFAAEKSDPSKDRGPEFINLKMGVMELKFQHWKHQTSLHNDCFNCHKTKIGVIDGWSKDVAHKVCIPCHDLENKGPVLCQECHKKGTSLQKVPQPNKS